MLDSISKCFGRIEISKLRKIETKEELIAYLSKKFKQGWMIVQIEKDKSIYIHKYNGYLAFWQRDSRILSIIDNGNKRLSKFSENFNDLIKSLQLDQDQKYSINDVLDKAIEAIIVYGSNNALNDFEKTVLSMNSLNEEEKKVIVEYMSEYGSIIHSLNPNRNIASVLLIER